MVGNPSDAEGAASAVPGGFHQSLAHLYRGEIQRLTVWRTRLDTTSNWAILLTAGMATFALGSPSVPHYVLLLGLAMSGICLVIEARRYRHLLHSEWRVSHLERHYFARLLRGRSPLAEADWAECLACDLDRPALEVPLFDAARLRLRHNYLMLVFFASAVWLTKLFIHPRTPASVADFYRRLHVGELIPGWLVAATAVAFVATATLLALTSPSETEFDDELCRYHARPTRAAEERVLPLR